MEKSNKKITIIKVGMIILASFCISFSQSVYAENETENNISNITNTENNVTQTTNTTTQNKKSSNANLKNLGIRPHDFSGFKPGITSYDVTVPEDTESVEVYAIAQDSKAKVSGIGKKNLEDGVNDLEVIVTAEDGTNKTYTIHVTKQVQQENTEEVQERYSGDGLASLTIENLELSPKFDTTIYEYTIKYIGENKKLDIKATATDPYYIIEITGNEELKEGENIINILVADPDGNNVATYQIIVNKSLVDGEAIAREEEERQKEEQKKRIIIASVIGTVVVIVVITLLIRHRKNKNWEEEYETPFSELDDKEEDQDYSLEDYEDYPKEEEELQMTKEQAREKFLNNYNQDSDLEELEEAPKRKRHKGKRFK